ncbi:MAG: hypothetical protein IKD44_05375 [Lentisphaeria bacterium]|nr:hypothetical protein [Lentisphaeria bacterium]
MKQLFILSFLIFSAAVSHCGEIVWSKEKLSQWKALRNLKTQFSDGILKLSDIKKDCQISSPAVKIDPQKYNHVSITYRASGTPRSGGEFYFQHDMKSSIAQQMWRIPALKADGQWHTIVLSEKALRVPELWFNGKTVIKFRLDITNAPGGRIEISEIKLFYKPTAVPSRKKAAFSGPLTVTPQLDEGLWKAVVPEFRDFVMPDRLDPYFQGKMIKSPSDDRSPDAPGTYYLRREFTLREKPVRAWLQFTADDQATASINGVNVETNTNWRLPSFGEVSKELRAGKNVLGFIYKNSRSAGGVFGELYIEYKDGSFERINTDKNFVTSVKSTPDWDRVEGKCHGWQKVIEQPGAPHPPWIVRLNYRDFSKAQHLIAKKLFDNSIVAGQKIRFRFDFKGKCPALPFHADIVLTSDNGELYKETVILTEKEVVKTSADSWKIETVYALPLYMTSRKLLLTLKSGAIFCKSGGTPELEFSVRQVSSIPGYRAAPQVRIVKQHGVPQIMLNGKPFYMTWGGVAYSHRPDRQARHSDGPVNVVTVYSGTWWKELGKIDTSTFDNAAENYRRNAKDAWFIWDLSIYPPDEFARKFPGEMSRDDKGMINKDGRLCFSFASKIALERMRWALAQAINYLERAPYANRIIGYRINSGHTIEWLGWDPAPNRILDFSAPAKAGFKAFAAKHYPELKDTSVPSLAERQVLDNGELLWDQKKHLKVIAYHDYYSNAVVDMMLQLLRDARRLAGPDKLLGTYYGYVMTLHSSGNSQMRAHYATRRVLNSGALNFIMSPQAYSVRQIGDFVADMKPFRSMQNNNIIPIIEDDTRTHIGPYITYSGNYQTFTEAHTIAVMRRNMGTALCRMLPCYYYALTPNKGMAFDFPAMGKEIAAVRKVGEHTVAKARRNAEIAYVISEESVKSMPMFRRQPMALATIKQTFMPDGSVRSSREGATVLCGTTFGKNYNTLARLGAPVDYILAEDLKDHPGDYKLYIFANVYKYDAEFLKAVEKLRKRKCTLLWVYAPGFTYNMTNSVANMKRLTGIDFVKSPAPLTPAVQFKDKSWMGGFNRRISPMFSMQSGKDVTVLGTYEDGTIGLGSKQTGAALSFFSGTDAFTVKFLTALARKAGVHIYSKNSDPIEANSDLLMLHARFPGKKIIDLPAATDVLDVYRKKIIGRNIKRFEFNASLHSTHLFYFGKDADLLLKKL